MDLGGRAVALYGRFSPGARERLQREVVSRGGSVAGDRRRRSHVLVVGSLAAALVDAGALQGRLRMARERGLPVRGERAFAGELAGGAAPEDATLPLATALSQTSLTRDDADVLAAFDLIVVADHKCRFGDAGLIRAAAQFLCEGRAFGDGVRILMRARDVAPVGRHRIVLTPSGDAALQWDDGLTTLEGQGYLALDEDPPSLDDLFEGAALAEASGELDEAARLSDQCGRADRHD